MAYVESNGQVLDDVTCPIFLFVSQCVFHATFRIDYFEMQKNSKYNRKKLQFITLLTAICIVSHIENSKNDQGYVTKQLTFWQGALNNITFIISAVCETMHADRR